MGVELHITRAAFWALNDDAPISAEEWLRYVDSDSELARWPENGPHFVRWLGPSSYAEPWLDWSSGNVLSKWPDTALYLKMLRVAEHFQASVQDDDGNVYRSEGQWSFEPSRDA
jgi:hypothetical protein